MNCVYFCTFTKQLSFKKRNEKRVLLHRNRENGVCSKVAKLLSWQCKAMQKCSDSLQQSRKSRKNMSLHTPLYVFIHKSAGELDTLWKSMYSLSEATLFRPKD